MLVAFVRDALFEYTTYADIQSIFIFVAEQITTPFAVFIMVFYQYLIKRLELIFLLLLNPEKAFEVFFGSISPISFKMTYKNVLLFFVSISIHFHSPFITIKYKVSIAVNTTIRTKAPIFTNSPIKNKWITYTAN